MLRVLIVDDEELARLRLRSLLAECQAPAAEVAGEAAGAVQALSWLAGNRCDVVLLDVQMPGADGTQLAAQLRTMEQAPAVVFVTAHAEHAVTAFELEAVDYLTKPVRRERLQAALARAAERLKLRGAATAGEEPVLVVNDRGRVTRVPVSEVLYLKAELKYVTLRTLHRTYVLDDSLSDLEERLGRRFLRIHRNALVARRAVRALERRLVAGDDEDAGKEGWAVRVDGIDEWLAVSRRQVAAVREALTSEGL
ncbi:response regulator transcription factor [Caldimonas thermodepolymerans]|jgi:Response regulator of the LytR/AlgR family|uniref:DNA-binding response regulator n=1 Tax=Caldimonas thermodepolymerans TaxID=215580 RepID=A0A2S5T9G1_9BURK|nr:LytTR family DNA-binding domain-containing protein [Caldimonas thermodepolymerans]PPE71645.1 DNA-binding response regulator [Caldimonas thermodepolymerans]QPC30673.1 response regulator transcription factor [Caldimonas thermodepolymerans]RDI02719.1 LytTR family two component transcriptional regulator [Caldimonas thermodepolymerans]TCP08751.1 LytTR family two component transcriptional regulator [Caldimonas thermodepolymerans]UZG43407.1 LytTR family DNA-binding domain-containing protein [Caldi